VISSQELHVLIKSTFAQSLAIDDSFVRLLFVFSQVFNRRLPWRPCREESADTWSCWARAVVVLTVVTDVVAVLVEHRGCGVRVGFGVGMFAVTVMIHAVGVVRLESLKTDGLPVP
jgi:hypothetical protein